MKIIKLTGIIFFILSYVSLGIVFIYENELDNSELSYGLFLWGLGIINVILNIIYGAKIKLPKLLFISMIISGLVIYFSGKFTEDFNEGRVLFWITLVSFLGVYFLTKIKVIVKR